LGAKRDQVMSCNITSDISDISKLINPILEKLNQNKALLFSS